MVKRFKSLEKKYSLIEEYSIADNKMDWTGFYYKIENSWNFNEIVKLLKETTNYHIHVEYDGYEMFNNKKICTLYVSRFDMVYCGGLQTHDYLFMIENGSFSYGCQVRGLGEISKILEDCIWVSATKK